VLAFTAPELRIDTDPAALGHSGRRPGCGGRDPETSKRQEPDRSSREPPPAPAGKQHAGGRDRMRPADDAERRHTQQQGRDSVQRDLTPTGPEHPKRGVDQDEAERSSKPQADARLRTSAVEIGDPLGKPSGCSEEVPRRYQRRDGAGRRQVPEQGKRHGERQCQRNTTPRDRSDDSGADDKSERSECITAQR
jgi:hypothetical protein